MDLTDKIPPSWALRAHREDLGLSQNELAAALGFGPNGARVIWDWEFGERYGEPFFPTPTAWAAFRYLIGLVEMYRAAPGGTQRKRLCSLLPESLR